MTGRILIAVVLTLGAVAGVRLWNAHLIAQGDAQGAGRVQTEWNTAEAKRLADDATARMEAAKGYTYDYLMDLDITSPLRTLPNVASTCNSTGTLTL